MSIENQIALLSQAIGADIKLLMSLIDPVRPNFIESTENLSAGNLVNIYVVDHAPKVRLADASVAGRSAHGYVLENYLTGDHVVVHPNGDNTAVTGLVVGDQYLSTTPGMTTDIAPAASGSISQLVGQATSSTSLTFAPQPAVVLP